jgi:hypothetical protein
VASPPGGAAKGWPAPPYGVAALCPPPSLLWTPSHVGKIGTSAFISSNSENISCVTFLKHKNSKKQGLALWHLVNRLVPENA